MCVIYILLSLALFCLVILVFLLFKDNSKDNNKSDKNERDKFKEGVSLTDTNVKCLLSVGNSICQDSSTLKQYCLDKNNNKVYCDTLTGDQISKYLRDYDCICPDPNTQYDKTQNKCLCTKTLNPNDKCTNMCCPQHYSCINGTCQFNARLCPNDQASKAFYCSLGDIGKAQCQQMNCGDCVQVPGLNGGHCVY